MTEEEAAKIKEEFVAEYMFAAPFSDYVNMVSLTQYFVIVWRRRGRQKPPAAVRERLAHKGFDPDEWYLWVGLRKALPETLRLPDEYKGIKVLVEVLGDIVAY